MTSLLSAIQKSPTSVAYAIKSGGLHVMMGKHIGTVQAIRRDERLGVMVAIVSHFDGSPWPIEPITAVLNIIERPGE